MGLLGVAMYYKKYIGPITVKLLKQVSTIRRGASLNPDGGAARVTLSPAGGLADLATKKKV
jgi:hypothetical protein